VSLQGIGANGGPVGQIVVCNRQESGNGTMKRQTKPKRSPQKYANSMPKKTTSPDNNARFPIVGIGASAEGEIPSIRETFKDKAPSLFAQMRGLDYSERHK